MNQKKLIEKIKEVQKAVADIPDLNNGGCGYFAQTLIDYLGKHNIKALPWSMTMNKDHVSRIHGNINESKLMGRCFHVACVIKFKSRFLAFDSANIYWLKQMGGSEFFCDDMLAFFYTTPLPKKLFKKTVGAVGFWNNRFKHKEYRPLIKKRVKNILTT